MEVRTSIEINRPGQEVFRYLSDMANNPKWQGGQERCTWTSEPPVRLGSTYDQEARFLGKTISSSFEVVEFVPDRSIRIKSTGGTMPIDVTRTVNPVGDDRCIVLAIVKGEAPMPMRLLGPLMKQMVRRSVRRDYSQLKSLLEAAGEA